MTTQIRGLNKVARNVSDAISMLKTAESVLSEVNSMLQRGCELSLQAASTTNLATDKLSLQSETDQLIQEIDRITKTTSFNNKKLFSGATQALGSNIMKELWIHIANKHLSPLNVFSELMSPVADYQTYH